MKQQKEEEQNLEFDEHWKVVNAGAQIINNTPEQLWQQAVDYFKWTDENPMRAKKTLQSGKEAGKRVEVEYKRPYSIKGFCLHAGISERYIQDIKETQSKDSMFYIIMEKILMIIYTQNLEGALVDLYNPIMVSKVLNLDKGEEEDNKRIIVEVVDTPRKQLPNSEEEILGNLDYEKVNLLKKKVAEEEEVKEEEQ